MASTSEKSDVFSFMSLRPATTVPDDVLVREYIRDEVLSKAGYRSRDLFSAESGSAIGRLVYRRVMCPAPEPVNTEPVPESEYTGPTPRSRNVELVEAAMALVTPRYLTCEHLPPPPQDALMLDPADLAERHYFIRDERYYLLPDRLADLPGSLTGVLPRLRGLMDEAMAGANLSRLRTELRLVLDTARLRDRILGEAGHHDDFAEARAVLFDNLYLLYVLRRGFPVSLEETMAGLSTLHALEALAIDELVDDVRGNQAPSAADLAAISLLAQRHPVLRRWKRAGFPKGFPLAATRESLGRLLAATPLVHPIFARLHHTRLPFNGIKPIGVGDLKVVKQWLIGYQAGEISHIDNVLMGENKVRSHRRLEKSEDNITFSSEDQSESQRDVQSTERMELQREAESVINSVLNVNANASVSYKGSAIVANVAAGMAYARTDNDVRKSAENFSREVVDKAVKRIQTRVSQQRTSVRIAETEETNRHEFDNKEGEKHVSGIYRWVDKRYRAQLYNFGRRMMFEFMVPEPAAFLVESRLKEFEARLEVPQPPGVPVRRPITMPVATPGAIVESVFNDLRLRYDLDGESFPVAEKTVAVIDQANGSALLEKREFPDGDWGSHTHVCDLASPGYVVKTLSVDGGVWFHGVGEAPEFADQVNAVRGFLDGTLVMDATVPGSLGMVWTNQTFNVPGGPTLGSGPSTLTIGMMDGNRYRFTLRLGLALAPHVLLQWQTGIYNRIRRQLEQQAEAEFQQEQQRYQAKLSVYTSRLAELRAVAVNSLLRGQSEAYNRRIIVEELKKHCLSLITRDFDADPADDLVSNLDAMGVRSVSAVTRRFAVDESAPRVRAGFTTESRNAPFPHIDIETSRLKGRHVQFLEQAFEWQHLGYAFYPYFWATPPKWIDMMNRRDDTDPTLTAFLQAGYAKVLIAVSPAYDEAVTHYLNTGEPWEGGPSPALGDPLFLPLHQELRRQQDDLQNAVAEGDSWTFTVPTSLVHLDGSSSELPVYEDTDGPGG